MRTNAFLAVGLLALASTFPSPAASQAPTEFKLTASDAAPGDYFGRRIALSGDTALVGASRDDDVPFNSGSAYVFVRSGTSWTQQAKLTAEPPSRLTSPGESPTLYWLAGG